MKLEIEHLPTDELYTWENPDTGQLVTWNTSLLFRLIAKGLPHEKISVMLAQRQINNIREHRGLEQPRLDRLTDPWLHQPVLFIRFPDGDCVSVDGHHRMVKLFELGEREVRAFLVEEFFASFTLFEVPEDIAKKVITQARVERLGKKDE